MRETEASLSQARELVEASIEQDSTFAPAWALHSVLSWLGLGLDEDELEQAQHAAQRAVRLDSTSAEAWTALGLYRHIIDDNYVGAARAFTRATKHNPGLANVRREYANFLVRMGFTNLALEQARRAVDLDPASNVAQRTLGKIYLAAGELKRAQLHLRRAEQLEADPGFGTLFYGAWAAYYAGNLDLAFKLAAEQGTGGLVVRGFAMGRANRKDSAREVLDSLRSVPLNRTNREWFLADRAIVHISLGNVDQALLLLDKAMDTYERPSAGYYIARHLKWAPWFDPIRPDPRFNEILRYLGLDDGSLQEVKQIVSKATA